MLCRRLHLPGVVAVTVAAAMPAGLPGQAAAAGPITERAIRSLARSAQRDAHGDKGEAIVMLDARVRARWGDFETFPVAVVHRGDLSVLLSMPYMTYRQTLGDYLRIGRPASSVPWTPAAVVTVTPERLDAPDILEIRMERGGRTVAPIDVRLKAMSFVNGAGDQRMIQSGEVRFPVAAIAPGASVSIAAVPRSGSPFVLELDDPLLRTLK